MRFATPTAAYYCGIDLHARTMYLVVLDQAGNVRLDRNYPSRPDAFLKAVQPFRPALVVASECVHSWYWLANTCAAEQLTFVLGHALGMKAVHGSKTKSDPHDGETIARLLRGGNLPMAYPYPKERRSLRDLLRTSGSQKPRRPTESTPKGLVSDALRSEGERVQAANSVSYRWKEESGFGLPSPARTLPVIGATTRRVMDGNEATLRACSCSDDLPVLRAISLCRHAVATTPAGSWGTMSFNSPTTAAFPEILPGRLPHLGLSRPAQRSRTLRPAYSLSGQKRPVASKAPTISLPPSPLRLLPAGTTGAGRDSHPLKMHALARRKEI